MYEVIYDGGAVMCLVRTSDGAFIPLDEGNRDFREFLAWNSEQAEPLVI